ncbi:Trans-aconitate 2-methyltransferase [Alphaproteobacteria bacterium SO-S41]|nr:Trans-aconitate 2-methyltransferase [Alphaproteobacteria bacterium SO-S41]
MPKSGFRQRLDRMAYSSPMLARVLGMGGRKRRRTELSQSGWDKEHIEGGWDRLADLDELAHHAVVAGYASRLARGGHFLDIGCGAGVTEQLLRPWYAGYHGVDFSDNAIEKARIGAPESATFSAGDARTFVPARQYDLIIMCEVLEYFPDIEEQMRRYAAYLAPGGAFILSMWASRRSHPSWAAVERVLKVRDTTLMWNGRGVGWAVKALTP